MDIKAFFRVNIHVLKISCYGEGYSTAPIWTNFLKHDSLNPENILVFIVFIQVALSNKTLKIK